MNLSQELKELAETASFTRTDLATWCDFYKSAMREWMEHDVTPHPIRHKHIRERLDLLRWALKHTDKLPVPVTIKNYDRSEYVKQVREYASKEFSKSCAAKRRGKDLDKHS